MANDIRPNCPHDGCGGHVEASTTVYLEVGGELVDDNFKITRLEFSHVNDELDGHPLDMEANLEVYCTEGHQFTYDLDRSIIDQRLAPQPIGNAPRTVGKRGGT